MIIKKGKSQVTFVYTPDEPACKSVTVVGTFNNWHPKHGTMRKQKDGSFRKRINLEPGEHRYKFLVDGNWIEDPEADGLIQNEYGTQDSLVTVG